MAFSSSTVFLCLLFLAILPEVASSDVSQEKRILLSDPQYIQQELTRFQSELQELQAKYNTQSTELADLKTAVQHGNKGAVFTRWGRKDCPANVTTLVYSGFAGGSNKHHKGGAAEYICMPKEPIWGPHKDLVNTHPDLTGYVYGGEYEIPKAIFEMPNWLEDVPCAVCLGKQHTAALMIPGRTQCYPGWTEAYHGSLATGCYVYEGASQYVCVDQHPQALQGGNNRNEDAKDFYGVKSKCGALPCPPYEDDKYLSCVVCMM